MLREDETSPTRRRGGVCRSTRQHRVPAVQDHTSSLAAGMPPARASSRVRARASDGRGRWADEPQLRHAVELADVPRELEERQQAGALARTERVTQLLEVTGEEARRVSIALARLVRQLLGLR